MVGTIRAAGHRIEIRDSRVFVDGTVKPVSPAGLATLHALARRPGNVVAQEDLMQVLPGHPQSRHAVETAVLRLRTALGDRGIVATVVKRGYRLAVDEN